MVEPLEKQLERIERELEEARREAERMGFKRSVELLDEAIEKVESAIAWVIGEDVLSRVKKRSS